MSKNVIKIESTNKELSSRGGIFLFEELSNAACLESLLAPNLPQYKISTTQSPLMKFKALMLGLVAGADSLDDMDRLGCDEAFTAVVGQVNAANTYGEYLRLFSKLNCKGIQLSLTDFSLKLRESLLPNAKDFILDIDSTDHEQYGKKMEGVEWNYKGHWCLDSLQAYDQYGFQYWMDVRPGATFTSNGSAELIHNVFKKVSKKQNRYLRADSGSCNIDFFNAANSAEARFVCAMRENMSSPLIKRVKIWKSSKKLKFRDSRPVEIGRTIYMPVGSQKILQVVFMRALKPGEQHRSLFKDTDYDYQAFVTNIGEHEMTNESLVEFYRGRGNAENYIKEGKYGFDLKHFPCQSIMANKAYGLIAAFAYNLMRAMAYIENPRRPHFSKVIRFRMVNLACQVVSHARSVTFRFNNKHFGEVKRWLTLINKLKFGTSLSSA